MIGKVQSCRIGVRAMAGSRFAGSLPVLKPEHFTCKSPMTASVDIVIATYNRADTLGRAIDSALAQDYPGVRVIVVDDGSTDDTPRVLAAFGDRITAIRQANAERGAARNAGMASGQGELLLFLDSDDELLPGAVSRVAGALLTRPDVGLAYGEAEFYDDNTEKVFDVFPRQPAEGDVFFDSAKRNLVVIDSAIVRRSLVTEVGGFDEDRELSGMEDWELWTRCLARTQLIHVPTPVVRVHFHDRNTVGNPVQMERAIRAAIGKMLSHPLTEPLLAPRQRELRAGATALIAHHHMLSNDTRLARKTLARAARSEPGMLRHRAFYSMAIKSLVGSNAVALLRRARRNRYLRTKTGAD